MSGDEVIRYRVTYTATNPQPVIVTVTAPVFTPQLRPARDEERPKGGAEPDPSVFDLGRAARRIADKLYG